MKILDYTFADELYYDREHNWIKDEGDVVTIGVTDFFQKTAKEIIFIETPLVGRKIEQGKPFSSIESGKWVGRLKAPLTGEITEVNEDLKDFPYLLNESPYDEGWIIKVKPSDRNEIESLLKISEKSHADQFEEFIVAEEKRIKEQKA